MFRTGLVILYALIVSFRFALAADPRCVVGRRQSFAATMDAVETKVRAKAEDVCPDRAATAGPGEKTALLDAIRARSLTNLNTDADVGLDLPDPEVTRRFERLRAFMALRKADVLVKAGALQVTPDVEPVHAPGFATLAPLSRAEGEDLQQNVGPVVDQLNAAIKGAPAAERRALITTSGRELKASLREAGQSGYERLVAQTPLLLFVEKDGDLTKARARFRAARRAEAKVLRELDVKSATGRARSLIYFGPIATKVLAENPRLCGAFHETRRELEGEAALLGFANTFNGLASVGTCLTAAALSSGFFGAVCVAFGAQELVGRTYDSLTTSRRANLLYTSTLAGAGPSEYEEARRDLTGKIVAAVVAAAPLAGVAAVKMPRAIPKTAVGVATDADALVEPALLGPVPKTPVKAAPVDVEPVDPYASFREGYDRHGYRLHVTSDSEAGTMAKVNHQERKVTLFDVESLTAKPTPEQKGSLVHEGTHVRMEVAGDPAAKIAIKVRKPNFFDTLFGSYAEGRYFGASEPFAHYYGGIAEHKLGGEPSTQALRGRDMALRFDRLLNPISRNTVQNIGTPTTQSVHLRFTWSAEEHLSPSRYSELKRLYPDVSDVGEYDLLIQVRPNQSERAARAEAQATLRQYLKDLGKLRSNFKDVEVMNPGIYPSPAATP